MNAELAEKAGRFFKKNAGLDCVLIVNTESKDPNFDYFSGLKGLFEHEVLVVKRNSVLLLASSLEYANAVSQGKVQVKLRKRNSNILMKELKGRRVGFNSAFTPVDLYKVVKKKYKPARMVSVAKNLEEARAVKTTRELDSIRKAVEITKKALREIPSFFREGVTEVGLAERFDSLLEKFGSEDLAFKTIVSFGKNSALPHHEPDSTKLRRGDLILIDAGAKFDGYCSDLTRTFAFKARGDKIEKMFRAVSDTRIEVLKKLKPGASVKEIAGIYNQTLKKNGFKPVHAFGHSLGVEVHESVGEKIRRGMVLAVEPGVYLTGFGGVRLEDDFFIGEGGAELL